MPAEELAHISDNLQPTEVFFFMRTTFIFANGEMPYPGKIGCLIQPGDLTIAADGGYRHARAVGIQPQHLVGDLDSIDSQDLKEARARGTTLHQYPSKKDQTDLELCIDLAISLSAERIVIVGSLGGRTDHLLANIFLLFADKVRAYEMILTDGIITIGRVGSQKVILGSVGDLISLLPWGGDAENITTQGLMYPLNRETLPQGSPRGMSNLMTSETASIKVGLGELLYFHTTI